MDAGIAKNNNNTMGKKQYGLGHTRITVPGLPHLKNKTAVIKENTTKVDGKCDLSVIAPEYRENVTYDVGDIVTHEGKLYACNKKNTGEWDDKLWDETTITEIISAL